MDQNVQRQRPRATFLQSAARFADLPESSHDEYCLLGRSNVGKSSFINHALENRRLARVSKTPGKTSLANVYLINDRYWWIDLPGYGYAKTSRGEKMRWSRLIADYCEKRTTLKGAIWLLDIRHPGAAADIQAARWLNELALPALPVLTKGDKLSRSERQARCLGFAKRFGLSGQPVVYSILENEARARFWERFDRFADDPRPWRLTLPRG